MNTTKLRELVGLKTEIQELEERLKALREQYEPLNELLVDEFLDAGTTSIKIDGKTVYLYRQLWASAARDEQGEPDWAHTCQALISAGLQEFVGERFNVQTVSAWVREQEMDETTGQVVLPDVLKDALRVTEKVELRIRKAGKGNG